MLIVLVQVTVKPECIEDFKAATMENARHSVGEAGIARFDVIQLQDDPARFILIEAYRSANAPASHKDTPHYQKWRMKVEKMMAAPRFSQKYENLFPQDEHWTYTGL